MYFQVSHPQTQFGAELRKADECPNASEMAWLRPEPGLPYLVEKWVPRHVKDVHLDLSVSDLHSEREMGNALEGSSSALAQAVPPQEHPLSLSALLRERAG